MREESTAYGIAWARGGSEEVIRTALFHLLETGQACRDEVFTPGRPVQPAFRVAPGRRAPGHGITRAVWSYLDGGAHPAALIEHQGLRTLIDAGCSRMARHESFAKTGRESVELLKVAKGGTRILIGTAWESFHRALESGKRYVEPGSRPSAWERFLWSIGIWGGG